MEVRQVLVTSLYVLFLAFTLTQLPGKIELDFDLQRLHHVIALNFSTENSIFLACFLLIGVTQAGLAALYLPGASQQVLSTRFFAVTGFFFGHYVSGVYQGLRKRVTRVQRADLKGVDQRALESRVFGMFVLCSGVAAYAVALGAFGQLSGSLEEEIRDAVRLLGRDRLVAAVFIDLAVSCALLVDPLSEDFLRRGWSFNGTGLVVSLCTIALISAVPGVGLGAYLTLRSRLPENFVKKQ